MILPLQSQKLAASWPGVPDNEYMHTELQISTEQLIVSSFSEDLSEYVIALHLSHQRDEKSIIAKSD